MKAEGGTRASIFILFEARREGRVRVKEALRLKGQGQKVSNIFVKNNIMGWASSIFLIY
jgi:hypothetical protein